MKNTIYIAFILLLIISCDSTNKVISQNDEPLKTSDTIRIANEELEYEVIIIDNGFNSWLVTNAKERGYYTENYLESRNQVLVSEYNRRVMEPSRYNPSLYEMQINYDRNTRYGYEVNYMIYNYLVYFQLKNNQKLAGFVPRP